MASEVAIPRASHGAIISGSKLKLDHEAEPTPLRRVLIALTGAGALRNRYTLDKLRALEKYRASASSARIAAVILLTPVPALLCPVLLACIPLQDPAQGVERNWGFLLHMFVVISIGAFGAIMPPHAAIGLTRAQFSVSEVVAVSMLAAAQLVGVAIAIGHVWRFPIPFTVVALFGPWSLLLGVSHVLVLRRRILFDPDVRGPLLKTAPWLVMQCSQIVVYPAISALFEAATELQQVLLTLCFPMAKVALKRVLRIMGADFHDWSVEMAVSSVEISASLYQSMIMQSTPSVLATAIIIGVDVVQGLMAVKLFIDKQSIVTRDAIVPAALKILERQPTLNERMLAKHDTPQNRKLKQLRATAPTARRRLSAWVMGDATTVAPTAPSVPQSQDPAVLRSPSPACIPAAGGSATANAAPPSQEERELVVIQALEMLQAAETILLVEYIEVAIPIVNAVYLAIVSHMDSAFYTPKLWEFHENPRLLTAALHSLLLYSLLQGLSVVAMVLVMQYRYRLSAATHLAFLLERHAWSIQGKMLGWLPIILNFSLLHYGVDFQFKFAFHKNLPRRPSQ